MHKLLPLLIIFLLAPTALRAEPVNFATQIKPLLSDRCFLCHGPDEGTREAELRLDQEHVAKESAIISGKPNESELIARIFSDDEYTVMPPPESNLKLTAREKDLLKRWIDEGAQWQAHWSFVPPTKPALPEVEHKDWPRHPLDHFVLAKLEANDLTPSPEVDKAHWLRRVSFDLTGLPPSLEELDAFLADDSPAAYETVVDRLLASDAYGERMAADWLDVARYSDTYGYQVDRDRYVWPWRDWVIRAFNRNLPYDQFIIEQLAGDLLPNATDEQILATTFNRLHPQKVEGGSVPEEFRSEYVSDRTQTTAMAFLGLTMECSRCHDHKYDPLSQKEYYEFSAFFDNIDEAGLYSFFTSSVPTPTLMLANDSQKQKLNELQTAIEQQHQKLKETRDTSEAAFNQWLEQKRPNLDLDQIKPIPIESNLFDEGNFGGNEVVPGVKGEAVKLTGDDGIRLKQGNFARWQPFSISLWINVPDHKDRAVIFHRSRAWTDAASRGYEMLIEEGHLTAALIHFWPGNALQIRTNDPLPLNEWLHVTMTYDGSSQAAGLKIFLNGAPANTSITKDKLTRQITGGGNDFITIGERFRDRGFTNGLVDEFHVFDRELSPLEITLFARRSAAREQLFQQPLAELSGEQRTLLRDYYELAISQPLRQQREQLRQTREAYAKQIDSIPEIMVMRELPQARPTYFLNRGAYDQPTDQVFPATPEALNPFPQGMPKNRLGLARWMTDPNNPLTARIAVNRYWQLLFGEGLVRTPEDFGSQGQPPTHPQLLDWLAVDFVADGWDTKRLLKTIVLSATYRQDSRVTAKLLQLDPENRLFSRFPSGRLPAEMLRDNALAVSGLLSNKVGGPPAKPYELEVAFKPTKRGGGDSLYRRSVYTYWKRTGPAPVMMTLDASKRDVCSVRRERTSSPLQAFVMLNGPQFVEAARVLSEKILTRENKDIDTAITLLFRTLTSRTPSAPELKLLRELYDAQFKEFQQAPAAAKSYITVGDASANEALDPIQLAAFTTLANTLMNYDEAVIKR